MRIILASSSPRRRELMRHVNMPFEVMIIPKEEVFKDGLTIYEQCVDVAYQKALNVYEKEDEDVIVIGSDTIVALNDKIYGKPHNYEEAFEMLKDFSGTKHEVITSLVMLIRKDGKEYVEKTYETCDVYVDDLSDTEIDDWIKNNDVYSKAGGYAIQEGFGKFVTKVSGDYFTIVGFPLNKAYRLLKKYCDA